MKLIFSQRSWNDYMHWQQTDRTIAERINLLIGEILRSPFIGTGRPEPLRENMRGWWSRRINHEHRLVYRLSGKGDDQTLEIAACRFHYR